MGQTSVVHRCLDAIARCDADAIEGLRGQLRPVHLDGLLLHWRADLPWPQKDGWIHLLMDQPDKRLRRVWEDGLGSPAVESQAVCIGWLAGLRFEELLEGGAVSAARVEAAIAVWRSRAQGPAGWTPAVRFEVQVGRGHPAGSARTAALGDALPIGPVAVRFHRVEAPIGLPALRVRLLLGQEVVTDRQVAVPAGHTTVYQAWRVDQPGAYEAELLDPRTGAELAHARFRVS